MIHSLATRLQRLRRLAPAPLFVSLACSACAGPTAAVNPHGEQRPEATTQDVKEGTAEPTARDAVHTCKRSSAHESLATPEAAVHLYIQSIAANDFACALRAFAAHERAARSDFTALARWVMVLAPGAQNAPAEYPMFVEINELRAKAEMAQATKFFIYGLLTDADPRETQTVQSDAQIHAFVQAVNPARLAPLRVVRIDEPRELVLNGVNLTAIFKESAKRAGADEMTERIALYELSGQFFWSGFRLCRYDKTWKIFEFASVTAGPSIGGVEKTATAEYEARVH